MTLKDFLFYVTEDTQIQVKLEQDTEHEEVDIVSSAKGINETYLNLGDHLVDLVYVADNVMVIETHKKGKR